MNATPPLIFLHVPKTAGTTLRMVMERQYAAGELYSIYDGSEDHHSQEEIRHLTAEAKRQIKAYCGHFSFGIHQQLDVRPRYITMLRDPVERVVSYYHHAMTMMPRWKNKPVSLMKFVNERNDKQVNNFQTRLISGIDAPYNKVTSAMLWTAIENIERHFAFVGLSEMFDESIVFLSDELGWHAPYYAPENVGRGRPSLDYYSKKELNLIRDLNRFDDMLYCYVNRSLAQRIKTGGEEYQQRLQKFREQNAEAQKSITPRAVWS